jgi:transcriptional antiterminator RfaH
MVSTVTENSKWLLVYTKAKEEQRAKKNLENQGFEIFLPMIAFTKLNQSKSITLKAMFPRYLFVKINTELDKWTRIQSTRGVSHLVIFGQRLAEMPNQVIAYLKSKADENDIFNQKTTRRQFHKGEKLVVKTGTFKGMEATFLSKKSQERVRVLLRFINHLITAEIPASDVGEKEIIEAFKL